MDVFPAVSGDKMSHFRASKGSLGHTLGKQAGLAASGALGPDPDPEGRASFTAKTGDTVDFLRVFVLHYGSGAG